MWVLASASIQVSPEDTRVSLRTQEDHGISERFEVRGDPALERLTRTKFLRPSISDRLGSVIDMGTYSTANSTRESYQSVQLRTYQVGLLVVINQGTVAK